MIRYREINKNEINMELFRTFQRKQIVTKCRRKENDNWIIKDDPFIDDWNAEDYKELIRCLKNTTDTNGMVYGAFID